VEHELMDLWNAVEKDKVVQAARRAAAARNKTRMEPAQPPLKKVPHQHQQLYLLPDNCSRYLLLCMGRRL